MAILMLTMTAIGVNAEELIVGTTDLLVDIGIIDPSPEEELMPMAASCEDYSNEDYSNIISGKPTVPEGYEKLVKNKVASVNSEYFISFVRYTYGSYKSNQWKKHMETWENDEGDTFECHYWQGPNGVKYYYI